MHFISGREETALQRGPTSRRDVGHDPEKGREIAPALETDAGHDQGIGEDAQGQGTDAGHDRERGEIVQAPERGVGVDPEIGGAEGALQMTEVVEVGGGLDRKTGGKGQDLETGRKGQDREREEADQRRGNQGHTPERGGTVKLILTNTYTDSQLAFFLPRLQVVPLNHVCVIVFSI